LYGTFFTLSAWSVAAPIGAQGDADHHISSIWCGWGESEGICEDYGDHGFGYTARVPYINQMCNGRTLDYWPNCEPEKPAENTQVLRTSAPETKSFYYVVMRAFVGSDVTQSIVIMRLFNSLLASIFFFFVIWTSTGRTRLAALSAWTFTLVPVAVRTISNLNPLSWSYVGVMSSWVFLHSALNTTSDKRQKKIGLFALYTLAMGLAAATRWDAVIFGLFSSLVLIVGYFIQKSLLTIRQLLKLGGVVVAMVIAVRAISPFVRYVSQVRLPQSYPAHQFFLFQLTRIPENLSQIWEYDVGQDGGGPGIIGILGLSLFAICLAFSLQRTTKTQIILSGSVLIFIFISMMKISIVWDFLMPVWGYYLVGPVCFLLGVSVLYSQNKRQFMSSIGNRYSAIGMLSLTRLLSLYAYMEFYVRRGQNIGVFANLSLNGGWWWENGPGPNYVLAFGALSFPTFLILAWKTVPMSGPFPATEDLLADSDLEIDDSITK